MQISYETHEDGQLYGQQTSSSSNDNETRGDRDSAEKDLDSNSDTSLRQRPRVPGLQRDIEVLKTELLKFISEHGQEGFMPMRKQLRLHGRVDIEKAITRMGGFRRIASLMNLSLAYKQRKPKGYWDNLENLQEEVDCFFMIISKSFDHIKLITTKYVIEHFFFTFQISRFQRSWGMDPSFMPSRKCFERAGKFNL